MQVVKNTSALQSADRREKIYCRTCKRHPLAASVSPLGGETMIISIQVKERSLKILVYHSGGRVAANFSACSTIQREDSSTIQNEDSIREYSGTAMMVDTSGVLALGSA